MVQNARCFYILNCQCVWRHSGVPFFDNFSTSALQKVARGPHVFNILTCTCASRHSGVQFFQIQTSESGPPLRWFVHFDLKMCFAPQRCAIFGHPNFPKSSGIVSFFLLLENVLRATAACNSSCLLWLPPHPPL